MARKIKRDDMVVVISGKDKGTQGRVLKVISETDRVLVEGVNRIKRHQSARKFKEAGIIEREAPIAVSNVMLLDPETQKPTRVRIGEDKEGKKARIAVKSGTVLDG
ncbi:MAG: 50S ribosomal protein L24 [Polyangiaceae bacterium]|nr:50S ribosomal protein L24 [Polyangiaceae bacterium]MBC7174282.1 50S ribosomal protein L24 [Polyangiaceae bacterium]